MSVSWTPRQWAAARNLPFYIAAMSGTPALAEGPPGVAKSQSGIAFAKAMGYEPMLIICSNRAAEDFSGIPRLEASHYETLPADFLMRATQPKCMLIFDEVTSIPPHIRAAVMSIWSERLIASKHRLSDDCIIVGFSNPPDMTPNGTPLEPPVANRFFHCKWKHDYEAWKKGMLDADLNFPPPAFPELPTPDQTVSQRIKYGAIIGSYTDQNPHHREGVPEDGSLAYPTPRSWRNLRQALAIADAMGAPEDIVRGLCDGFVGPSAGGALMALISTSDLMPADDYIEGRTEYKFRKSRVDEAVVLMANIGTAMRLNYSDERLSGAVKVYCDQIGTHNREIVLAQLKALTNTRPEGSPIPAQALKTIREFGSRLTPAMKKAAAAA